MQQFVRAGFIRSDDLVFEDLGNGFIIILGTIDCVGGIYIQVRKLLQIVGGEGPSALVQTVDYSYNVAVDKLGNAFRYDAPHPDHRPFHHVHRYDPLGGDKHGTVDEIHPQDDWPTLGEVIGEAQDWFFGNAEALLRRPTR